MLHIAPRPVAPNLPILRFQQARTPNLAVMSDLTPFEEYNRRAALDGWPNRVDSTLAFEAEELREAHAVWKAAAAGRPLPLRRDMQPRMMKRFLSQVALMDIVREAGRRRFRIRVTGTALERTFGGLTGRFLDEALPEPFRSRWDATLKVPLLAKCAARSIGRVEYLKQTYLTAETFFGPLGADVDAPDFMLVVVHTHSDQLPDRPILHTAALSPVSG